MYPEQYPQPKKKRKIILIVAGSLLVFGLIIALLISAGNKASQNKIAADLASYSSSKFSIKYPKDFKRTYQKELVTQFSSPENTSPQESVAISGDDKQASTLNMDTLDSFVKDAEKQGITVKQSKEKDYQRVSFSSASDTAGLTVQETYYIYSDYVWKVVITYGEGTVLANYLDTVVSSFVYTPPTQQAN